MLKSFYKVRMLFWTALLINLAHFGLLVSPVNSASSDLYRLVVFGDSLSAGYGLSKEDSFTSQLSTALSNKGYNVTVINSGVSGDTTSGGLARLDWSLDKNTDGIIVELGGNDALRGLPAKTTQQSLDTILQRLKTRKIPTLLAGMLAPPNLGTTYGAEFNKIFPQLAQKYDLVFYPFFLDGVAGNPALNQPDGIHPTAQGVRVIVQNILPKVEELLNKSKK